MLLCFCTSGKFDGHVLGAEGKGSCDSPYTYLPHTKARPAHTPQVVLMTKLVVSNS